MDTNEYAYFVGVDWGSEQHPVCVLNPNGEVVAEWRVAHGGAAVREWCERLGGLAPLARLAVAIESPNSPVTEALLEHGAAVFSINPKQLDRFRDRHFPAGSKDDRRDSFVLATSLRTDRACFRRLAAADPALLELRALTRLDETLKADLRAYASRIRELLLPVFPQLLELCPGADEPWVWELLEMAPTPRRASQLSRARLTGLLRRHRIRRISAEQLQEQLRRPCLPLPAPSFERAAQQLGLVLPVLRALSAQHAQVRAGIADGIERLKQAESEGRSGQQRDVSILLSLPGVGITIAATLLAEASTALALRDYHALPCGRTPAWPPSPGKAAKPAPPPCAAPAACRCATPCTTWAWPASPATLTPRLTTSGSEPPAAPMAAPCAGSPTAACVCCAPCSAPRPRSIPTAVPRRPTKPAQPDPPDRASHAWTKRWGVRLHSRRVRAGSALVQPALVAPFSGAALPPVGLWPCFDPRQWTTPAGAQRVSKLPRAAADRVT